MLYNNHDNNGKSVTGEKTTRNNGRANTASSSSKKLNEDHNLNELESKGEQDGRLVNGHAGRSFSSGKRSSPVRTANGDYEDESDSGESSNTSTSSCPTGGKKENQKTTQVQWKHRNRSFLREASDVLSAFRNCQLRTGTRWKGQGKHYILRIL